jgi:hypothetical protein
VSARAASASGTGSAEGPAGARGGRDSNTSARPPADRTHHAYGSASWGASGGGPETTGAQAHGRSEPPVVVPGQGGAPRIEHRGDLGGGRPDTDAGPRTGAVSGDGRATTSDGDTHGGRSGIGSFDVTRTTAVPPSPPADRDQPSPSSARTPSDAPDAPANGRRKGTPLRGTDVPQGVRRRGGLSAWARRLTGGRGEQETPGQDEAYDETTAPVTAVPSAAATQVPEVWPDPAALLLTALGPGARLWERGPGHPEALTVRLGTADRAAPDGSGLLPAVPVTADLREAGALGLAGPRARLAGLARAVVAQLAALHAPETLEIVLISTDRSRPARERVAEWSWLGWLPHVRPGHGQDCRLLLAHDREQAAARTDELLRRLDDHLADAELASARGTVPAARSATPQDRPRNTARRPSWARDDVADGTGGGFPGPYTVVVVDGDPGGADLRKAVARLAAEGPRAGIHIVCLAETAPASPASPVTDTYEAACAAAPTFRECGAVGLLSGDVATALRLMRVARAGVPGQAAPETDGTGTGTGTGTAHDRPDPGGPGSSRNRTGADRAGTDRPGTTPPTADARHADASRAGAEGRPSGAGARTDVDTVHLTAVPAPAPVGHGTVAAVDAVSVAWAERFARALAPLRTDGTAAAGHTRVSSPLPQSARLLDELGLARATPPSLMTRWADAADDPESLGGRAWAVLGAGPRGPVCADLVAEGPHLLIEGPAGSGRTELLRAVVASLAAAERPDRLSVVLMDGRDSVAAGAHGEGLRVCTDVPHVTTHLTANDPVRMREFAQSLSAELKRRAELLGRSDFTEWHTGRELSGRLVAQRTPTPRTTGTAGAPGDPAGGDLDSPPSSTIRLRPAAARRQTETAPPLPRLVVVVDDLDALVSPPLGSPGRPAAGSVIRALEAVSREGERLGVHLVAATDPGGRTAESEAARRATLRVTLDTPATGPEEPAPGRGRLTWADGRVTAFQAGRVTGRIPRTATLRPTVVPLEWERMGDPPARRPVRELGNGPTDLALLASALERAAREVAAAEVPSLL